MTGKENILTFGPYPEIGLAAAQEQREKAKARLSEGLDPGEVEQRGAPEMAARVLEAVGMIFRYGCATGLIQTDVTQGLRQFLQERPPVEHFPHVAEMDLPALLASVERYHGRPETRLATKLMMHTFPWSNELRWAQWGGID